MWRTSLSVCHCETVRTLSWQSASLLSIFIKDIFVENGLPHQSADWFAMTIKYEHFQ